MLRQGLFFIGVILVLIKKWIEIRGEKMTIKHIKKKHTGLKVLALAFAIALTVGAVFSHFGGFGTGKCADKATFKTYAKPVKDIEIPESAEIIALGEATHGNTEFQRLKLDVFQVMVEKYGVRAFCLEADYGCCEAANRYIHGGEVKKSGGFLKQSRISLLK